MSWSKVFKINKNMKRALNEQIQDLKCTPMRVITTTQSYTPEKTGLYKVICVGAGGNGGASCSTNVMGASGGGGGGVAIKILTLSKNSTYNITVGTTASFAYDTNTIFTATGGASGSYGSGGVGGSASGGDYNYTGTSGTGVAGSLVIPMPGSVGVSITELIRTPSPMLSVVQATSSYTVQLPYGDSLLNYGGGGSGVYFYNSNSDRSEKYMSGKPASVIIIPLEMEE